MERRVLDYGARKLLRKERDQIQFEASEQVRFKWIYKSSFI